jgi:hypothetical protein
VGVAAVLAFFTLGGIFSLAVPDDTPTPEEFAQQIGAELGFNGFPLTAGEALAARFSAAYLAYDPNTSTQRAALLKSYGPTLSDTAVIGTGQTVRTVTAPPIQVAAPTLVDPNNAVFHFGAPVATAKSTAWLYLDVPVYADDAGNVVVSGSPALVPAPVLAGEPTFGPLPDSEETLPQEVSTSLLQPFLVDWAAGDTTRLALVVSDDASTAARTGLGGVVKFQSLDRVWAPGLVGDDGNRKVFTTVTWAGADGGQVSQTYRIELLPSPDGSYKVRDIVVAPPGAYPQ